MSDGRGGDALPLNKKPMKTTIEIRVFAVEQAVRVLGCGSPTKDVVAKAAEIERYITEGIILPAVDNSSPMDALNSLAQAIQGVTESAKV